MEQNLAEMSQTMLEPDEAALPIMASVLDDVLYTEFRKMQLSLSPNCQDFYLQIAFAPSPFFGYVTFAKAVSVLSFMLKRYNAQADLRFFKKFQWPKVLGQLSQAVNSSRSLRDSDIPISFDSASGSNLMEGRASSRSDSIPESESAVRFGDLLATMCELMTSLYNASISEINSILPPEPYIHYLWSSNVYDALLQVNASLSPVQAAERASKIEVCLPVDDMKRCTNFATAVVLATNALYNNETLREMASSVKISRLGAWAFLMGVGLQEWSLSNVPGTPSFFHRLILNEPTFVISSIPTLWSYNNGDLPFSPVLSF